MNPEFGCDRANQELRHSVTPTILKADVFAFGSLQALCHHSIFNILPDYCSLINDQLYVELKSRGNNYQSPLVSATQLHYFHQAI